MTQKIKILFVCTGNIFRSPTAQYCLRDFLKRKKIKDYIVSSAGTEAHPKKPDPETIKALKRFGISLRGFKQRKLSKALLAGQDLVVAMAKNHQQFIKEKFGLDVPLFNEIVSNRKTSVLDVSDGVKDPLGHRKEVEAWIEKTIRKIHRATPKLYEKIHTRTLLFSHFVDGKMSHRNGFPFIPLHETKHTVAFMSIDIPEKEDGHILVIPKRRYPTLEDVPKHIQNELIHTVALVGKSLMLSHDGYNVLLNNGRTAGQYITHTHFHIIPRKMSDRIHIEIWKSKKLSKKEFLELNRQFKRNIEIAKRSS